MHGGIPETLGKTPIWHRGAPLVDTRGGSAPVVVRVLRGLDSLPLSDARVIFGAASKLVRALPTDSNGYAMVYLPAGRTPVLALRLGHKRLTDTVTVRGGFADTLWLRLGTEKICFT
jgi:hypothetical protein